ncbi:MAG: 2-C-methyl-D-erythritol 4-phosphate cytidylyltransferase [Gemmatimonadetes bacterium]|nr:2-C-methyl-D-erythritol 4-phosphate cytidylyltransferase [Gemmatimonadota bacterium]
MSPTSPAGSPPDVGVVVPAAGRGERAGAGEPKQFRAIGGVPMLLRSIRPFASHPRVAEIVVVLPALWARKPPAWLAGVAGGRLRVVSGGDSRTVSVLNGVAALSPACRVVLVHDAARPFVSVETIDAVIHAASDGHGAIAAIPVSDTLKRADATGQLVAETVDRAGVWRAQTPQGFPRSQIEAGYQHWRDHGAVPDVTDDAALVEAAGFPVRLVPDRATNIKVTTADDFVIAEALAGQ